MTIFYDFTYGILILFFVISLSLLPKSRFDHLFIYTFLKNFINATPFQVYIYLYNFSFVINVFYFFLELHESLLLEVKFFFDKIINDDLKWPVSRTQQMCPWMLSQIALTFLLS